MAPKIPPKVPPNNRKAKLFSSRTIRSETSDSGLKDGILTIPQFLSSREYEIKAFEHSQLNTKYASSTRVFQSLPRTLRRRTASHNVKRIPKRLRAKALREMQNTTNGVPTKKPHLRGRELHRLRVQKKLLRVSSKIKALRALPNTVGGPSVQDRFKVLNTQLDELIGEKSTTKKLNNIVGAYDNTGVNQLAPTPKGNTKYAHRQKEFTWCPTHLWHAKRFHMSKKWGFQIPFSPNQKCFRATSRAAKQGTLLYETSYYGDIVVECTIADKISKLLLELTKYNEPVPEWLSNGLRSYSDWLYVDGSRVSMGQVLVEPNSFCVLIRVHPCIYEQFYQHVKELATDLTVNDCRYAIGSVQVHGPTALRTLSKVLHLDGAKQATTQAWRMYSQCKDAQIIPDGTAFSFFALDPRFWKHPVTPPPGKGNLHEMVMERKSHIEHDAVASLMLSLGRERSYENMHSVSQIGKAFAQNDSFAAQHDRKSHRISGSNNFPVLITKANGSWTVSLPWFWLQPLWSKLVQVSEVKVAGLRQAHQVNFEHGKPTFPHDFPFLPEGYKENELVQKVAEIARKKLPLSKQAPMAIEGKLELAGGDWHFLRKWIFGLQIIEKNSNKAHAFAEFREDRTQVIQTSEDLETVIASGREELKATRTTDFNNLPIALFQKSNPMHRSIVEGKLKVDKTKFPQLPVVQIKIELIKKGTISDFARIYSCEKKVPSLENLIGFVTTGSFNFNLGIPTGVGLVSAQFMDHKRVYIRNIGCTTFSVACIETI